MAFMSKLRAATHRRRAHPRFSVPVQISKHGGKAMPGSVSVTNDHDVRVPLKWNDDVGPIAHPPTSGTTVASDNPAVIARGDVAPDGMSVVLRTAGDGTCNVTVKNGALSDTISVTVGEPVPSALAADPAGAVSVPKGTAA
jgi:hypothetical protein